jgi:hypothetical protein
MLEQGNAKVDASNGHALGRIVKANLFYSNYLIDIKRNVEQVE